MAASSRGRTNPALGYDFLGIFLVDPETRDRVLRASRGWEGMQPGVRVPPGAGISRQAVADGRLHYRRDFDVLTSAAQQAGLAPGASHRTRRGA